MLGHDKIFSPAIILPFWIVMLQLMFQIFNEVFRVIYVILSVTLLLMKVLERAKQDIKFGNSAVRSYFA